MAWWRGSLGEDEAELVVAGCGGDSGVGEGEHVDAVLIGVGGIADVYAVGDHRDDVAGCGAVDEGEIAEGAVCEGGGEVVLGGDGGSFDDDGAGAGAVGEQHFLSAAHQLAVDDGVAHFHGDGLEASAVAKEVEGAAVAGLEDLGGGLVGVGGGWSGGVRRSAVDPGHREVDGGDFAYGGVERERSTAARGFVQHTVDVVVDGDGAERGAYGGVEGVGVDRVGAGVVRRDGTVNGTKRGDLGGADVTGDQCHCAGACASRDAEDLVLVEVVGAAGACSKGDAVEGARSGSSGYGGRYGGLGQTARLEHRTEAWSGASGAASGQFDAEGAFNASVSQQLLGCAEVRAYQVAAYNVALQRRDAEVADQDGVSGAGVRIGAVLRLNFGQDEALASKKGH